jgi:hypothetical protein
VEVEPRQQNHDNKIMAIESWLEKQICNRSMATRIKIYGFHMCSVESMNLVEGLACKSVGYPLGSLGLVVELIRGRSTEV